MIVGRIGIRQQHGRNAGPAGRQGLAQTIAEDIALARQLFEEVQKYPQLEALTTSLSITTFRYNPPGAADPNTLNERLLDRIQKSGELFLSNAVIDGKLALSLIQGGAQFLHANGLTLALDASMLSGDVKSIADELYSLRPVETP